MPLTVSKRSDRRTARGLARRHRVSDRAAWAFGRLEQALSRSPLPKAPRGLGRCAASDFMLMRFRGSGAAEFKNIVTRRYLILTREGALRRTGAQTNERATYTSLAGPRCPSYLKRR
jgi:hypothetical protein